MNSQQAKTSRARMNVVVAAGFIVSGLTLVSLVASFQTYRESFRDCGSFLSGIFAFLTTLGIEIAFILLVRGMSTAYEGREMYVAGFGAAVLLFVMATNFVVHSHVARNLALGEFETTWCNYIGLIVPFATIGLFVALGFISPEARERRQLRKMHSIGQQRAMDYKEEYLNSPELDSELAGMRPLIAREVRGYIASTLPNAAHAQGQSQQTYDQRPTVGFAAPRLNPEDSGRIAEQMRSRYFPRNPNTTGRLNRR